MKRKCMALGLWYAMGLALSAQTPEGKIPWRVDLTSKEEGVRMKIDLYEECVEVPGMEMLGPMHGFLGGKIYGVWMVTSFSIKNDSTATIRFSNDLGSDTQECILTHKSDGSYLLELKGGVVVKKVVNRKLAKIKNQHLFEPKRPVSQ